MKKLNNNFTHIFPLTAFNTRAYTDTGKSEIPARSYAEQFSPNPYFASPDHFFDVHEMVNNFLSPPLVDPLPVVQPTAQSSILLKNLKSSWYR